MAIPSDPRTLVLISAECLTALQKIVALGHVYKGRMNRRIIDVMLTIAEDALIQVEVHCAEPDEPTDYLSAE
jgi:hypothetical protein